MASRLLRRVAFRSLVIVTAGACVGLTACSGVSSQGSSSDSLTIMTNSGSWSGFTPSALKSTSTVNAFYKYFHKIWAAKWPKLQINEEQVEDMSEATSKTLLAVRAGNPPNLIPVSQDLGLLVADGALDNLDSFYKKAGITANDFLPGVASSAQVDGHWYAIPGASDPSTGDLLYMPATVRAVGLNPNDPPKTWNQLFTDIKKTTKFGPNGQILRAGFMLNYQPQQLSDVINLYCGQWATYDPQTKKYSANAPCIQGYFNFQMKVLKFYGGNSKWQQFVQGDPYIWDCSPSDYLETGKAVFTLDAWWAGFQMDTCPNYKKAWKLAPAPVSPYGNKYGVNAVRTQAWMVAIPKGASNAQLAFNFAKLILWDHGALLGPTTNGPVLKSQLQPWADTLISISDKLRAEHGAAGQPMKSALQVVIKEALGSKAGTPGAPYTTFYNSLMDEAWQQIEYGQASVTQALNSAQRQINEREAAGGA
jgi:ABC-type glycerol-3-phosphate transport system substrate-binding protein